jgi:Ras-related protein Rab-2A
VIVGDSNVGKSCILLKFINANFRDNHDLTIGVEFGTKIINLNKNNLNVNQCEILNNSSDELISNNNKNNIDNDLLAIKLQIWDTAGQETFKSITRAFYRGAAGVLLVYDLTNRKSFENILSWLSEIQLNNINNKPVIILVGNKNDLDNREVSYDEGISIAQKYNLLYIETSAKTSFNINLLFIELAKNIYLNLNLENNRFENTGVCILKNIETEKKCCYST